MLENTEEAIINGQSRETASSLAKERRGADRNPWLAKMKKLATYVHKTKTNKTKTQHNMCWTTLYTQTNTSEVIAFVRLS